MVKEKLHTEEEAWDNSLLALYTFDKRRKLFRTATKKIIKELFEEYITKDSKVLEIGSGLGELVYHLLPKVFSSNILQTEQGTNIIKEHKRLYPHSNIQQANVYKLPFRAHSFDAIIGLFTFSTFVNLDKAVKEMKRVLRKGGYLIHITDIGSASNIPLYFMSQKKANVIPFPKADKDDNIIGVQLVKRSEFNKKKNLLDATTRKIAEAYSIDPKPSYAKLNYNPFRLLLCFAKDIERVFATSATKVIKFNDFFIHNIQQSYRKEHLTPLYVGYKETQYFKKGLPWEGPNALYNVAINDCGKYHFSFDRLLAKVQKIKIVSRVHVAVMKK